MQPIFIDTWAWLCLRDKREVHHDKSKKIFQEYLKNKIRLFTTDYILDETFTLLFKRLSPDKANESIVMILEAIKRERLQLVRIDENRFQNTITLRTRLIDKPNISFTDLSSMVVMKEYEIDDIFTADNHFIKVGMGFNIIN